MKLILVPCITSEWRSAGRLMGRVELDPTPASDAETTAWASYLQGTGVTQVLYGPDQLSARTARLLAKQIGASIRKVAALEEVDVGLWAGLTDEELRARYASCYRELCENPLHVTPPEGESFAVAGARIGKALQRRVSRNGQPAIAVVLRPLALALARRVFAPEVVDADIWRDAQETSGPITVEVGDPNIAVHT